MSELNKPVMNVNYSIPNKSEWYTNERTFTDTICRSRKKQAFQRKERIPGCHKTSFRKRYVIIAYDP